MTIIRRRLILCCWRFYLAHQVSFTIFVLNIIHYRHQAEWCCLVAYWCCSEADGRKPVCSGRRSSSAQRPESGPSEGRRGVGSGPSLRVPSVGFRPLAKDGLPQAASVIPAKSSSSGSDRAGADRGARAGMPTARPHSKGAQHGR